jgi:hypothetical protein
MTTLTMIIGSIIAVIAAILLITAFKPQWLFLCRSSLFVVGRLAPQDFKSRIFLAGFSGNERASCHLQAKQTLILSVVSRLIFLDANTLSRVG